MQTSSPVADARPGQKRPNALRTPPTPESQRHGLSLAEFWKRLDP